ncbi:MAG: hypothetical protein Q8R02_13615 [Hyphomonadaceae bacterium]|nr:hypothetical protein [Hyphomonadaceae bacterium]
MLFLAVAPNALSQTPPATEQKQPPQTEWMIRDESGVLRSYNKAQIEELKKQGAIFPLELGCPVDYSDIDAEKAASKEHRRKMKDEIIPLKHQYEQELYYRQRAQKRLQETCGAANTVNPSGYVSFEEITRKACDVIGEVCMPVKHW